MPTAIKFCTCESKYQDEKYGKQKTSNESNSKK